MIGIQVKELARLLGLNSASQKYITGYAVDSRKVLPGFVFFALPGEKVDGHDFIKEAFAKGAVCAVISHTRGLQGQDFLLVENVLSSLHKLAAGAFSSKKARCIGITGSVGKTTTKEFLSHILTGAFFVEKTPGNANSQTGLPLTILNEFTDSEVFVAEMGMSQKGEITSLLSIVPPEIAVVTKVAYAHTLYFPGGIEEVAQAKAEILLHSKTKKSFLHAQTRSFAAFQNIQGAVFYGHQTDPLLQEGDAVLQRVGTEFILQVGKETTKRFSLPFQASHLTENFFAAALVARELGMEWEAIFLRAESLAPYKMRFETIEKQGVTYVNDAYNANPASTRAALENLPKPQAGKRVIAVLGEMRELGKFTRQAHEEIGKVAALHADLLLCLGEACQFMKEEFENTGKPALHFSCLQEMKQELSRLVEKGDVVLVKGSKSLAMWQLLE